MVLKHGYTKDESYSVSIDEKKKISCAQFSSLQLEDIFNANSKRASSVVQVKNLRTKNFLMLFRRGIWYG